MSAEFLYLLLVSICLLMVVGVWLVLVVARVLDDLRRRVVRRRRNRYMAAYFRAHERPIR